MDPGFISLFKNLKSDVTSALTLFIWSNGLQARVKL